MVFFVLGLERFSANEVLFLRTAAIMPIWSSTTLYHRQFDAWFLVLNTDEDENDDDIQAFLTDCNRQQITYEVLTERETEELTNYFVQTGGEMIVKKVDDVISVYWEEDDETRRDMESRTVHLILD